MKPFFNYFVENNYALLRTGTIFFPKKLYLAFVRFKLKLEISRLEFTFHKTQNIIKILLCCSISNETVKKIHFPEISMTMKKGEFRKQVKFSRVFGYGKFCS